MTPTTTVNLPDIQEEVIEEPAVEALPARPGHRVTLGGLNAFYGDNHAVKGLDLEFAPNKVTGIIGPSGCGKSTMIRCINRMHEEIPGARVAGRVMLDEVDLYDPGIDVVAVRRSIGMVFQKPNPFPTMSIFDNVASGLRLSGVRGENLSERVHRALRGAGLWAEVKHRLDKPGIGLSGGQQQRLCVARAIAIRPEVLLLDEPASALDPISTARLEETISELKSDYTVIIVTHNMGQAARLSDHTGFMYLGHMVEFGETDQVFTNPATTRARDYITGRFG
jgi:phosphate transport system ATP-binding protein